MREIDAKNSVKLNRVSSAAQNMSALVDDMVKKARKSFKSSGNIDLDAKFLKESVSALRELYGLLGEYDEIPQESEGVLIKIEKQLQEWSK